MPNGPRHTLYAPPLDTWSIELFSAHMVQHELMMLVGAPARELTGGEPSRGRTTLVEYGCDTCHTIPGVRTPTPASARRSGTSRSGRISRDASATRRTT